METASSRIADYLQQFRRGDKGEVFFDLLEMGNVAIPILIAEFRKESDPHVRDFLVEIVWQYRDPSVIPFLSEALQDRDTSVWRQAMDGLVALKSPAALDVLRAARAKQNTATIDIDDFCLWLDEAIEQAEDQLRPKTK